MGTSHPSRLIREIKKGKLVMATNFGVVVRGGLPLDPFPFPRVEFLRAVLTREQDPTVRMDLLAVIEKFEKLNTAMRPAAPNPPAPQAPV